MQETFDIVNVRGIELVNNIRANIGASGQNATMRTSNSLRFEITGEGTKIKFKLFGREFFMAIQTGRRPTPDKKPSRGMIQNITMWVAARGIDESAIWGIATKIQQEGTQLWKEGGRTDIVDPAVDTFVNDVAQDFLKAQADNLVLKIRGIKW